MYQNVSKTTTISMSKEDACNEAICQFIIVISINIADLWSNVLKSD